MFERKNFDKKTDLVDFAVKNFHVELDETATWEVLLTQLNEAAAHEQKIKEQEQQESVCTGEIKRVPPRQESKAAAKLKNNFTAIGLRHLRKKRGG